MKTRFTAKTIDKLPVPETGSKIYRHDKDSSIAIRVSKKSKIFQVMFKNNTSRSLKPSYPELSFSKAQEIAHEMRRAVDKDYYDEEYAKSSKVPTIADLAQEYIKWSSNKKAERSLKTDIERIENHILPALGKMNINKYFNLATKFNLNLTTDISQAAWSSSKQASYMA